MERDERMGVSAFSLMEIVYAAEKATNPLSAENRAAIGEVLGDAESPFEVLPVDAAVADRVALVPRAQNADPGDRLIVATAEVHGLAVITADAGSVAQNEAYDERQRRSSKVHP